MIQTTTWKPDTCGCVLEYEWDNSVPQEERTHTVSKIIKACPAHSAISGKTGKYNAVLDENQRKNKVHGLIFDNLPDAVEEVTSPGGDKIKQIKGGKEYKWSFDKDRNLEVDLVGFTSAEKTSLGNLANAQFGAKVKLK